MADKDKKKGRKPDASEPGGTQSSTGSATTGSPSHTDTTREFRLPEPPEITERQLRDREACIERTHKTPPLKEGERSRDFTTAPSVPPTTPKKPD